MPRAPRLRRTRSGCRGRRGRRRGCRAGGRTRRSLSQAAWRKRIIRPSAMSSEQPRVLVVEDNAFDRALLQAHLHPLPADVAFAGDGIEAWEMLERDARKFDVILLDRTMPRMNGLELLARLKADARCRTIPVILQTGSVGREEMLEGINAGAHYYLTKPYNADVLRMVIRTAASDSNEIRRLQSQLDRGFKALALAQQAVFFFRTIDEARDLGSVLARACPDAEAAVIGLTEL